MSLPASSHDVIPQQTLQRARAAFPKGNPYMRMPDALGPIYKHAPCAALFSPTGRPAEAPAQLALLPVMPFAEGLSEAPAAEAVRARIDWTYALALERTDPGFDASVRCECRQRLITGQAERLLFETMWTLFREQKFLKATGRQRTDSTPVWAAIQSLHRLECVGEALRQALNVLATAAPAGLPSWVPAAWFDRYRRRFAEYRLPPERPARSALAEHMGTDAPPCLATGAPRHRDLAAGVAAAVRCDPAGPPRALAQRGGAAASALADQLSLGPRSPLWQKARDGMDRLQSPCHRNL
jgi:transposase